MAHITSKTFDVLNAQNVKEPVIVLEIAGVPYTFASAQVYTSIKYDDPDVLYDGTYNYDGLRPISSSEGARSYIDRKGSRSTISQKLEQWDGRASIETMNIKVIDKNGLFTSIITPGSVITDIINAQVKVWFGYQQSSFKEDYVKIFSGYINQYDCGQGYVNFIFTDDSSKRKQSIFTNATALLSNDIDSSQSNITLSTTNTLYQTITNALGNADSTVSLGILIGEEIMSYANADITSSTNVNVGRHAYGTLASGHTAGDEVDLYLQFIDNPISIALKVMLSGWNGPWATDISLRGIVNTDNSSTLANSITFLNGVDLIRDYGLTTGDFITLRLSPSGNNGVYTITNFANNNRTAVVTPTTLVQENPTGDGPLTTVADFRSKYDVYPVGAGLSLTPDQVNVTQYEYIRDTFLNSINFTIKIRHQETSGKTWIEENLFKPIGAYSLTQGSRISIGLTHPPLATDLTTILDGSNIINAKDIVVTRGVNTRFFYNEVVFNYDYDIINDQFNQTLFVEDAGAQERLNQVSTLVIDVKGLPYTTDNTLFLQGRANRILLRYRYAAETIQLMTNFGAGGLVDAGDIVVLTDDTPSLLQISNTETGTRGIYSRVMEVQERTIDISAGNTKMTLLSNNGFFKSGRYVVISPSSLINTVVSTSQIIIEDSFGSKYPGAEWEKWIDYQGLKILVHDSNFVNSSVTTFTLDLSNPYIMNLSPPLSYTPAIGDIVEFANYDDSSASSQSIVKSTYGSWDYNSVISSGSSGFVFTLSSGLGSNYQSGQIVYVMSPDGTRYSPDVQITSIVGDIITVGSSLGFTPSNGDFMELGGFLDGGSSYRLI